MKIGFTYDLKTDHAWQEGQPEDAFAELDKEATIEGVRRALVSGGHEVVRIGHVRNLLRRLPDLGVDIVFNICEGLGNRNRESQVPVILDLYNIPFVGSDGLTLGLTLDKAMAKKVFFADHIPTARYFVADTGSFNGCLDALKFPLIVKPNHEGSSKGISEDSIVHDKKSLKKQVDRIVATYRQHALVEEFIAGSEFTVLVIGNEKPKALPPVQIQILGNKDLGNLLYTSRRLSSTDVQYLCPADISGALDKKLRETAERAFVSVECRDFGRVDMRVDRRGRPYVLEINPLPSLSTEDVFPLVAKAAGLSYNQLIVRIVDVALRRYGLFKMGRRRD